MIAMAADSDGESTVGSSPHTGHLSAAFHSKQGMFRI